MLHAQTSMFSSAEKPFAAGRFTVHWGHGLIPCSSEAAGAFPQQAGCLGPLESHCAPVQQCANVPVYIGQLLSSSSGQVSCEDTAGRCLQSTSQMKWVIWWFGCGVSCFLRQLD